MLDFFKSVLMQESEAISSLQVEASASRAVSVLLSCRGKLFCTGIGKAGYVARKAASTFSTTGTPSSFLHPGDASHGDVGVISHADILLAFSNSGETREVIETIEFCKQLNVASVIAITSSESSSIAALSDVVLSMGSIPEPCPLGMTPTASTAAMMALSDALALTVMRERGFTKDDFAARHHGGYLGKRSRS